MLFGSSNSILREARPNLALQGTQAMAGVFVSHSSHDKPFVRNLAASLLAEGIPVWLDSWELEIGDPLLSRIERGIQGTSLFVVVVSRKSIESGWVERELRTALAREVQTGRQFVFPIKIDECPTPDFMEERVYADFKHGFSRPFSLLVSALEKHGARSLIPNASEEIICLSFTKETSLDQYRFLKNLESFRQRHPKAQIEPKQVKVIDDHEYINLKLRLHARIDKIQEEKWWTPDFELELKRIPEHVQAGEKILCKGVASIINSPVGAFHLRESLHWFLKFTRSRLCYLLYRSQNPDLETLQYGKDSGKVWGMSSKNEIADFYGIEGVFQVDAWSTKYHPSYETVYIGLEQLRDSEYRQRGSIPYASGLDSYCMNEAFFKYVLPQALYWSISRNDHKEVWKQEDVIIGPH